MEEGAVDLGIPGVTDAVEVARGGFSTIYRATQSAMERTVAIKLIHATVVDPVAGEHFLREVRATGRLSQHPNVAPVYDVGTTASAQPYLIMPYYEHGSLQDHLTARGALSEHDAVRLARTLASTLDYVHHRGILHRDIKPANVLLTEDDEPLLADFGVARLVDGSVPVHTTGANVVTWAYGPPEAFTGGAPTPAWDIYSLGATVYAMLTGNPPFVDGQDVNVFTVLNRIGNVEVPDLRDRGVSAPVAAAVRQTMAKEPTDRPSSAAEFAALLARPLPLPRPAPVVVPEPVIEVVEPEPALVVDEPAVVPEPALVVDEPAVEPEPVLVVEEPAVEPEPAVDVVEPEPAVDVVDAVEDEPEPRREPMAATSAQPVAAAAATVAEPVSTTPAERGSGTSRPSSSLVLSALVLVTVVLAVSAIRREEFLGYGYALDGGIWEDVSLWAPLVGLLVGLPLLWRRPGLGGEWLIGAAAAFVLLGAAPITVLAVDKGDTRNTTTFAIWWVAAAVAVVVIVVAWRGAASPGPRIGAVPGVLVAIGGVMVVIGVRDFADKVDVPLLGWLGVAFLLVLLVRAFALPDTTTGAPALVVGGILGVFSSLGGGGATDFDSYYRSATITSLVGYALVAVVGVLRWRSAKIAGASA